MAIGDIKIFTISENGFSLTIQVVDLGGSSQCTITSTAGSGDLNAIWWSDLLGTVGDWSLSKSDSSLNMNGTGIVWDGFEKLSSTGLGKMGEEKPTFLSLGETLDFEIEANWADIVALGIRATSVNGSSSIKGVDSAEDQTFFAPDVSIKNVTVTEGGKAEFTVSLSNTYPYPVTVFYATGDGTAGSGSDYTAASGSVTIPAGQLNTTICVTTNDDALFEGNETFTVTLSNATSGLINATSGENFPVDIAPGGGTATGTILNDDPAPVFSIASASATEGGLITFTVTRTGDAQAPQEVSFATSIVGGDTASASDFTAADGTLSFSQGETTKTFTVQTTQDALFEGDETFTVALSAPTGGALIAPGGGTATGTILNDDPAPVFSIASASATEGGLITFTVTRTGDAQAPQEVSFATSIVGGDTASASDFTAADGTLSFSQGETTKTFTVQTTQDALFEGNETFTVALSAPTGGALIAPGGGTATGTILNDDPAPVFSIASASATEGGLITFTVTRTGDAQAPQEVSFATSIVGGDTASASDFTAADGTLSFSQGETTKTFTVQTTQDALFEGDETFTVALSAPTGGALIAPGGGTATGTILNDDPAPVFSIASASATEGGLITFTVTRTGDAQAPQEVSFATSIVGGDTASASDFTAADGTLSFSQGETTKTFTVQTTQDALFEGDETFTVALSAPTGGALIAPGGGTATGTILNDDPAPVFSIASASATEGGLITFTVTRTGDAQAPQEVSFATSIVGGDTASASDFTAADGTLSFSQGETTKTFTVQTTQDALFEGDETFTVALSAPTGGALIAPGGGTATGTILNDDVANQAPTANRDVIIASTSTTFFMPVSWLLGNDVDPEGAALTVTGIGAAPTNWTITPVTAGSVITGFNVTTGTSATTATNVSYTISDGVNSVAGTVAFSSRETASGADTVSLAGEEYHRSYIDAKSGADVVDGSSVDASLSLIGSLGHDNFIGGAGNDRLSGAAGDDFLSGESGGDILTGGTGTDVLNGGAGNDQFRMIDPLLNGTDTIQDFTVLGNADTIGLLQGGGGWNAANTTATSSGATLNASDYATVTAIGNILGGAGGHTNKVVAITTVQTTAEIETGLAGAANAYVLVFNSGTGRGELWHDTNWSDTGNRVKVAVLDNLVTVGDVTGMSNTHFVEWA